MIPIDERKDENITSSLVNIKTKKLVKHIANSFNDLEIFDYNYKPELTIQYKKTRNKMRHLTPKKKNHKK